MIIFLEGLLSDKQPTRIELNVAGVGYEVLIPLSSYDRLPPPGEKVKILIHDHIREDQHLLFGFMTKAERRMFELLLGISGIGPKIALGALSGMSVRDLKLAVAEGDVKRISSISGIGKKTAERMVIELRDKLTEGEALEALAGDADHPADQRIRDAALALISLGYKQAEAQKMLQHIGSLLKPEHSVEDLVRLALTH